MDELGPSQLWTARRVRHDGDALPSNFPEAADSASSWTDKSGDLWFFGGYGFDSSGNWGRSQRPLGIPVELWAHYRHVMPAFSLVAGIYCSRTDGPISPPHTQRNDLLHH